MVRHQPFSVFPKLDRMAFHVVLKYWRNVHFVTKHTFERQTDGRTDRIGIAMNALSIAVAR